MSFLSKTLPPVISLILIITGLLLLYDRFSPSQEEYPLQMALREIALRGGSQEDYLFVDEREADEELELARLIRKGFLSFPEDQPSIEGNRIAIIGVFGERVCTTVLNQFWRLAQEASLRNESSPNFMSTSAVFLGSDLDRIYNLALSTDLGVPTGIARIDSPEDFLQFGQTVSTQQALFLDLDSNTVFYRIRLSGISENRTQLRERLARAVSHFWKIEATRHIKD